MKYKANVIKRVAFLLMTIALAVAMVACEGAVGKPGTPGAPGQPGQPGQPGEIPKLAPQISAPFAPVMLVEEGEAETIDLSAHFFDPEGEALTYDHAVESEGVVTAALAEAMLTITPVAEGTATITVTGDRP